jgi:phosphatidylglycerophosphate synthase
MKLAPNSENAFAVDLMTTLRKEKFSPHGWYRFYKRSWDMSCNTANANPILKRSWAHTTIFIAVLTFSILGTSFFFEGPGIALRLLPGFLFCVAWQQSDLFCHLGLNRQAEASKLLPVVGFATTLTDLRGVAASFLFGRLVGGISTSSELALLVFLAGIATDIFDGPIARLTQTQTKLGQIRDGEADFCLYLAITMILIQNGVLPLWLGLVMLLRFLVPLVAALGSYFLLARPVHFGSTIWGKFAGVAQTLYFLVLLAPREFSIIKQFAYVPLLVVTLILLAVAPLVQIVENVSRETF